MSIQVTQFQVCATPRSIFLTELVTGLVYKVHEMELVIFKAKQRTAEKDHWIRSRSIIKDGLWLVKNIQKT